MPKKKETEENPAVTNNAAEKNDKKPSRRKPVGNKKALPKKKTNIKATTGSKPVPAVEPTDDQIRIRAYFIAEHRQRLLLPGDESADWLEARRQLLSEIRPR